MKLSIRHTPYLTEGNFDKLTYIYKPTIKNFTQLVFISINSSNSVFSFTFDIHNRGVDVYL